MNKSKEANVTFKEFIVPIYCNERTYSCKVIPFNRQDKSNQLQLFNVLIDSHFIPWLHFTEEGWKSHSNLKQELIDVIGAAILEHYNKPAN